MTFCIIMHSSSQSSIKCLDKVPVLPCSGYKAREELHISEKVDYAQLMRIKVHKACEPDELPKRVLRKKIISDLVELLTAIFKQAVERNWPII